MKNEEIKSMVLYYRGIYSDFSTPQIIEKSALVYLDLRTNSDLDGIE